MRAMPPHVHSLGSSAGIGLGAVNWKAGSAQGGGGPSNLARLNAGI